MTILCFTIVNICLKARRSGDETFETALILLKYDIYLFLLKERILKMEFLVFNILCKLIQSL